eukprot:TRINITY_DN28019_c0_g1_i1.p1 TRINITY_DN28019_c0_g1~~TRINITY_DN28019_c0_g1_i1.p1  ORF type:complete len:214 (+),score=51.26 TRINITY_DN28019_c0_g1_i1:43-642(+)
MFISKNVAKLSTVVRNVRQINHQRLFASAAAAAPSAARPAERVVKHKDVSVAAVTRGVRTEIVTPADEARGFASHTLVLDEPKRLGGQDSGPTPLHTLLGALAGCEGATAHTAAQRMKFAYDGMRFEITGVYDPSAFVSSSQSPTHFHTVNITVLVVTSESDERIKQLKDEVERLCPVASLFYAAKVTVNSHWHRVSSL